MFSDMDCDDHGLLDAEGRTFEELQALISEQLRLAEAEWEFPEGEDIYAPLSTPLAASTFSKGGVAAQRISTLSVPSAPGQAPTEVLAAVDLLPSSTHIQKAAHRRGCHQPALEATEIEDLWHGLPELLGNWPAKWLDASTFAQPSPTSHARDSHDPPSWGSTREPSPDHTMSTGFSLSSTSPLHGLAATINASERSWCVQEDVIWGAPIEAAPCQAASSSAARCSAVGFVESLTHNHDVDQREDFEVVDAAAHAAKCRVNSSAEVALPSVVTCTTRQKLQEAQELAAAIEHLEQPSSCAAPSSSSTCPQRKGRPQDSEDCSRPEASVLDANSNEPMRHHIASNTEIRPASARAVADKSSPFIQDTLNPVVPQTARTRPLANHRIVGTRAYEGDSALFANDEGTSSPRALSTMKDVCTKRVLPFGMVDPVSLLLEELYLDDSMSGDVEQHLQGNCRLILEPFLEVDKSAGLSQAEQKLRHVNSKQCRSSQADVVDDPASDDGVSTRKGRKVNCRSRGQRNWRGVDRPADICSSKPSAKAIRKSQVVPENELGQSRVAARWGAIQLDTNQHPIACGHGPARAADLGCERGFSSQYSCQSEAWWSKSSTHATRCQGEFASSLYGSQLPPSLDSVCDGAPAVGLPARALGKRCGCSNDVACCHWPSGRAPHAGGLPPLDGAEGGKARGLGLSLSTPAPSSLPQWLRRSEAGGQDRIAAQVLAA